MIVLRENVWVPQEGRWISCVENHWPMYMRRASVRYSHPYTFWNFLHMSYIFVMNSPACVLPA